MKSQCQDLITYISNKNLSWLIKVKDLKSHLEEGKKCMLNLKKLSDKESQKIFG